MRVDPPRRLDRSPWRFARQLTILLVFLPVASFAEARTYRIEATPDSRFALEVFKTGLMNGKKHLLVFEQYQGRLEYDAANVEQSHVELTVQSASMVVKDDWVNEKEREKIADEALNKQLMVNKHPEIRFLSGSIRPADGPERYEVQGDLTIRDLTRPVVVHVTLRQQSEGVLLFEGAATVRMKDYGMKPPSAALGLIGTKNEMKVSFRLPAVPASP
jgi:polyisoprenoid-binding protein YceI